MTLTPTGKFAVDIGGAAVTVPGVYTVSDKSAMVAPRGVPLRALAIVASAKGGYLNAVTRVLAGDEARLLRGGTGAQMAAAAFLHGAKEVFFVRVDQAVPATLDLGTGGLFSINPGRASSALQAKTAPNAARADAIDLFIKDATGAESDEEYRMVGPMLDLTYVGLGTVPTAKVERDATTGTVTLKLGATNDMGATLTLDSDGVPTMADVTEAINRSSSWVARSVSQPALPLNVAEADTLSFTELKTTVIGGPRLVQLLLEARPSRIARLALPEGPGTEGTGPGGLRITSGYEFFQGGSDGPVPSANDYISALRRLEELDVTGVAIDRDDPYIVAALTSHVETQSGVKERRERYGGYGIAPTLSKSEFLTKSTASAQTLNDVDRMYCAGNLPYMTDIQTRRLTRQHGGVLAAAVLAIKVTNRPEIPVTWKSLRFPRLEYTYNTEELEVLIENGVMPAHVDQQERRMLVVSGITTWTLDANVASRKLHAIDAIDYLNRKVRQRVTSLSIGEVADEGRVKTILASVAGLLSEEVRSTRNPQGVLTPGIDVITNLPVKAFRNLVAIYDGFDLVGVDFDCNLVGEIDKVRVRPRFTPVRIEARQ